LRNGLLLFFVSYIAGNLWLLFSILEKRFPQIFPMSDEPVYTFFDSDQSYTFQGLGKQKRNNFYDANEFELKSGIDSVWAVMYFALTTLSTIGFGDYKPISDEERILMVFCFILGVAIFSISLGNFSESAAKYAEIEKDFEDSDHLS